MFIFLKSILFIDYKQYFRKINSILTGKSYRFLRLWSFFVIDYCCDFSVMEW